jgi:hypothetical protein
MNELLTINQRSHRLRPIRKGSPCCRRQPPFRAGFPKLFVSSVSRRLLIRAVALPRGPRDAGRSPANRRRPARRACDGTAPSFLASAAARCCDMCRCWRIARRSGTLTTHTRARTLLPYEKVVASFTICTRSRLSLVVQLSSPSPSPLHPRAARLMRAANSANACHRRRTTGGRCGGSAMCCALPICRRPERAKRDPALWAVRAA